MTARKKKIGIMGGTFDPIHIGHLIIGENAYQQFQLDKVLFMPSGNPPHKLNREGRATNEERVEMVRRAISSNPHFELSFEEMNGEGFNYTKETLRRLTQSHPDTEYYFIMGADSLFQLEDWKEPDQICRLCTIVVAVRYHVHTEKFDCKIHELSEKYHAKIEKLDTSNIDISSQMIRSWLNTGKPIRYYVPDTVADYIQKRNLYRGCETDEVL